MVGAPSVKPEKPAELAVPAQRPEVEPEAEVVPLPALNDSDPVVIAKLDEYLGM